MDQPASDLQRLLLALCGPLERGVTLGEGQRETAFMAMVADKDFTMLGLGPLEFNGVGIVQGGLLKTYAWSMTDASMAAFETARARATNEMLVQRYMEELWNQGNLALIEELLAEDFVDHTPRPGLGTEREALRTDIAGFHEEFPNQSVQFRVDALIVTEDKAVVRNTMLLPGADGSAAAQEGQSYVIILGLADGQIHERWAASISWPE